MSTQEVDPQSRNVGYLDLTGALKSDGCAICNAANRAARKYLDGLLWEFVNDSGTRVRLREAHGFCREHTFVCVEVADGQAAGLGMAILYQDFLRHARDEAIEAARAAGRRGTARGGRKRDGNPLGPHRACTACATAGQTADNCVRLMAETEADSPLGRRIRAGRQGICLAHLSRGLTLTTGEQATRLLELYLGVEERLRLELAEFIRKQDYRNAGEPRGSEQGSWRCAPEWIVGAPS